MSYRKIENTLNLSISGRSANQQTIIFYLHTFSIAFICLFTEHGIGHWCENMCKRPIIHGIRAIFAILQSWTGIICISIVFDFSPCHLVISLLNTYWDLFIDIASYGLQGIFVRSTLFSSLWFKLHCKLLLG